MLGLLEECGAILAGMSPLPSPRGRRARIPAYALYGEPGPALAPRLHIEEIASRSRLYRWEIAPHLHRGLHQVVWLQHGSVRCDLDELRQRVQAPAAIVVPASVVHGFHFAPATQGWVLTLEPRNLVEGSGADAGASFETLFARAAVLALEAGAADVQRIEPLLRALDAEYRVPGAGPNPVPVWLARAVVWRLAAVRLQLEHGADPHRRANLFGRLVHLIEQHHLEHWSIGRYAERLGATPERLNRLARAEAGCSALELVHERVTREACRRLLYIAAPVSKLAFELGFDDPAYFCRFFKRRVGMSPSAYRRQHETRA